MSDRLYTVKSGDTLQKISHRFLGSQGRFMEIFNYNRNRLRSDNPDEIFPGENILIPLDDLTEKKDTISIVSN